MIEEKNVGVKTPSETPFSNRGVSSATRNPICSVTSGVYVIFDWIQVTIYPFNKNNFDINNLSIDIDEYLKRVSESWMFKSDISRFNDVYDLFYEGFHFSFIKHYKVIGYFYKTF